jgi:uncharacterized lipoprotein YmbA
MRLPRLTRVPSLGLVLGLLSLLGCASSEPTRFYVLNASANLVRSAAPAEREPAIGIGPVTLPEHLDRSQIVTRTNGNELNVAEFHQWAGPLRDNITQVLAENLSVMIPTRQVHIHPWKRATAIDYQLTVEITRFDRQEEGDSVLNARWRLLAGDGKTELMTRASSFKAQPAGADYPATVAAMNETLEAFSREVVDALETLP